MKQYLSALIQKIGRLNVSIYLLLLSVGYGLYSILPYTLPKIFSGSGGLHVNPFFMILSILSFLVVPILNYPNNLAMQSVRKYSKQVLFDDLVKKKYMYFDDMETGKIQDLFSESSFCTRSLLYSCVQFIIKHSAIIIINSTAFFNFHFLLGVTYILSYSVYFFISIVLLKKQNNRIHSTLLSASDVNSYLIDYCQNLDSIYSFRSYDKEKEKYRFLLDSEQKNYYGLQLAKLDQFSIYSVVECIRMCGIAGTLDCDRTLVIRIRGRTPGTVLFFHIHAHSTIHADTILTGSLSGNRSKNITQSLYRALTDHTMRRDTVNDMGSLPGMIRA